MTTQMTNPVPAVQIRPDVTILSVLRHLNYKAWFALAEFIDNAIQSYIANSGELRAGSANYRLRIAINVESIPGGRIIITDNAAGIALADFPRAFKPAQMPSDRTGLSEFGMGMKSAACWFARNWMVRTKALGELVERTVVFDIDHIVAHNIETLATEERPCDAHEHYTVVVLEQLHHPPHGRTIGKIKDHLASIYREFLRSGDVEIVFNGTQLVFEEPAILVAPPYRDLGVPTVETAPTVWRKDIDLDFGEGQRVRGFAALRAVGSTSLAGFALLRRGRLIQGSFDETYRPFQIFRRTNSYTYQRLFGELHVEGFEVSHTKDGFRWEQYEDEFLDCLKDALEDAPIDLLSQAENYRALPTRRLLDEKAERATTTVAQFIESQIAPILVDAREHPASAPDTPAKLTTSAVMMSERIVTFEDGTYAWHIVLRTTIDPAVEDWVRIAQHEMGGLLPDALTERSLTVELALAHPFSSAYLGPNAENIELLLRVATAAAVTATLLRDMHDLPSGVALYHFNKLLRGQPTIREAKE